MEEPFQPYSDSSHITGKVVKWMRENFVVIVPNQNLCGKRF